MSPSTGAAPSTAPAAKDTHEEVPDCDKNLRFKHVRNKGECEAKPAHTYGYNGGDNRLDDSCDGRNNGINAAADGRYDGTLKKDAVGQRR